MHKFGLMAAGALAGVAAAAGAAQAEEAADISSAITEGAPILELRPRYETVSRTGSPDGDALTNRTRLGWETASFHGVSALIEFEDVRALAGDYNDGVPPAEPHGSISDPEVTELNRLQLKWRINDVISTTVGRQNLSFDDQRFVGPSNWRQDSQTFDAARVDVTAGAFKASYAYVDHFNRSVAEAADWESQSHLLNASYAFSDAFKLTGFIYALDFETSLANSVLINGVRATGKLEALDTEFSYAASYASEEDYADNPGAFDLDYAQLSLEAKHGIFGARIWYEQLEGDGVRGFLTPTGSGHSYHGWASVFGTRPADGLVDLNASATISPELDLGFISGLSLTVRYYDFETERTGVDLGNELDWELSADITDRLGVALKSGDFEGAGAYPDTTRTWLTLDYKL